MIIMLLSNGYEIDVLSAGHLFAGYGRKEITVEFTHYSDYRKFSVITTDIREVDRADEFLENGDLYSYWEILAGIVLDHCEDRVIEWIESLEGGSHE